MKNWKEILSLNNMNKMDVEEEVLRDDKENALIKEDEKAMLKEKRKL